MWKLRIDLLKFFGGLENAFKEDYYYKSIAKSRIVLLLCLILYSLFGILDTWSAPITKENIWFIRYAIVAPLVIIVFLISFTGFFKKYMQQIMATLALILGVGIIMMIALVHEEEAGHATYYAGLMLVSMASYTFLGLRLYYALIVNLLIIFGYEIVEIYWKDMLSTEHGTLTMVNNNFFFITTNIVGITAGYFLELYHRKDFLQRQVIEIEKNKTQTLLYSILPTEIADILKIQPKVIAQHHDNVSILFADVVNFTPLSEKMDPKDLVDMLNDLFSRFDTLVEKYRVEKIKTIGDCYMAASGIPSPRQDHAPVLASLGLDMLDCTNRWITKFGNKLDLRIGINSGSVVAGVIGHKKFAYDLWGDTVNIASRMESHGRPGKIQVTKACYELIKDHYNLEPGGEVLIKGKGPMPVWFINGKK